MSSSNTSSRLEIKSPSDFEQWLNEINLFAQEMHAELHEIGGLLSMSLASGYSSAPRPAPAHAAPSESIHRANSAVKTGSPVNDTSSDPLAALRERLAQQLRASQAAQDATGDHRRGPESETTKS
jgi:hypothetical protein